MKTGAALLGILAFVLVAHLAGAYEVFRARVAVEPGWERFRTAYRISEFGDDGHFVRAAQSGYNTFYFTHKYAWRFTRKTAADADNACASCHRAEDLAYAFVNSDRYDARAGRRISFEERVMQCFARRMDGYVPTLYDPTIRDLRILARALAHHLQLGEGAMRVPG
jgi:cytochrome c